MLEGAYWSRKLRPLLVKHLRFRDALIVKHSNSYNGGIPDFSITIGKHTEWFELKIAPNAPTKAQALYLEKLDDGGHLITVGKNSIQFDMLKFCNPNPLGALVEEIVAMFEEKR